MVKKALFLSITAVMLFGLLGTASAQPWPPASTYYVYPHAITDPVPGDLGPTGARPFWPTLRQGTTLVGNPPTGSYDILINGYIEAYARVDVYDNWINFDWMDPTTGTFDAPHRRYAFTDAAHGDGVSTYGTVNGEQLMGAGADQNVLYVVDGSTDDFDLAGFKIQTNARLDLLMEMGGWLTRVDETGNTFAGTDTRRADLGDYQLRNQYKLKFKGRFLNYGTATDPAIDADGTQFVSPTGGAINGLTDYNSWTWWGTGVNSIDNEDGWIEPDELMNDPWTGTAGLISDGTPRPRLQFIDLVVERGQAQGNVPGGLSTPLVGTAEAAEVWMTHRVLRRGLQDVQGNYRGDVIVNLTYRESDAQWVPPSPMP